jgi:hypothetical protein
MLIDPSVATVADSSSPASVRELREIKDQKRGEIYVQAVRHCAFGEILPSILIISNSAMA